MRLKAVSLFTALLLFGSLTHAQVPVVDSLVPNAARVGAAVSLHGSNFSPTAADNVVMIGPVRANVSSASAHALSLTVPSGAGYAPVTVTTGALSATGHLPFVPTFPSKHLL